VVSCAAAGLKPPAVDIGGRAYSVTAPAGVALAIWLPSKNQRLPSGPAVRPRMGPADTGVSDTTPPGETRPRLIPTGEAIAKYIAPSGPAASEPGWSPVFGSENSVTVPSGSTIPTLLAF